MPQDSSWSCGGGRVDLYVGAGALDTAAGGPVERDGASLAGKRDQGIHGPREALSAGVEASSQIEDGGLARLQDGEAQLGVAAPDGLRCGRHPLPRKAETGTPSQRSLNMKASLLEGS
ncbi:hypothetical protein GCM10022284_74570 [Streptomyces hundungensis]